MRNAQELERCPAHFRRAQRLDRCRGERRRAAPIDRDRDAVLVEERERRAPLACAGAEVAGTRVERHGALAERARRCLVPRAALTGPELRAQRVARPPIVGAARRLPGRDRLRAVAIDADAVEELSAEAAAPARDAEIARAPERGRGCLRVALAEPEAGDAVVARAAGLEQLARLIVEGVRRRAAARDRASVGELGEERADHCRPCSRTPSSRRGLGLLGQRVREPGIAALAGGEERVERDDRARRLEPRGCTPPGSPLRRPRDRAGPPRPWARRRPSSRHASAVALLARRDEDTAGGVWIAAATVRLDEELLAEREAGLRISRRAGLS